MAFVLTPASLKKLCRELKLYSSAPELNDVLHLQCKGIATLENLDAYTGLKTLYLEQNAIDTIQNLDALVNLRCLYLGRNAVQHIGPGLSSLVQLDTLDLSENYITCVDGLDCLPALRTLNLSGNKLKRQEDVAHLQGCPSLTSLDLASNAIEEGAIELVAAMTQLSYLRLMGNPGVREYKHYRKRLLVAMPSLNYLDEAPVVPKERRLAAAFIAAGVEAERAEREVVRQEEDAERERHRKNFDDMVERARQALPQPHNPMRFRAVPPGESDSDDEGLPAGYSRKERRSKAVADAAAAEAARINAEEDAAAAAEAEAEDARASEAAAARRAEEDAAAAAVARSDVEIEARAAGPSTSSPAPPSVRRDASAASAAAHIDMSPSMTGPPDLGALDFKAELLARAAARDSSLPNNDTAGAAGTAAAAVSAAGAAPASRLPSQRAPAVWGTASYRRLWEMAIVAGEAQEQAAASAGAEEGAEGEGDAEGEAGGARTTSNGSGVQQQGDEHGDGALPLPAFADGDEGGGGSGGLLAYGRREAVRSGSGSMQDSVLELGGGDADGRHRATPSVTDSAADLAYDLAAAASARSRHGHHAPPRMADSGDIDSARAGGDVDSARSSSGGGREAGEEDDEDEGGSGGGGGSSGSSDSDDDPRAIGRELFERYAVTSVAGGGQAGGSGAAAGDGAQRFPHHAGSARELSGGSAPAPDASSPEPLQRGDSARDHVPLRSPAPAAAGGPHLSPLARASSVSDAHARAATRVVSGGAAPADPERGEPSGAATTSHAHPAERLLRSHGSLGRSDSASGAGSGGGGSAGGHVLEPPSPSSLLQQARAMVGAAAPSAHPAAPPVAPPCPPVLPSDPALMAHVRAAVLGGRALGGGGGGDAIAAERRGDSLAEVQRGGGAAPAASLEHELYDVD